MAQQTKPNVVSLTQEEADAFKNRIQFIACRARQENCFGIVIV